MKKWIIILVALAVAAIGGYCYYYYYVDEVTERYLIKITPPVKQESSFGTTYSDPKVEIEEIDFPYENDSTAVAYESEEYKRFHDYLLENLRSEDFFKDTDNEFVQQAKINAYKEKLAEERMILSISHTRSIDKDEFLKLIKKHGILSDKVEEYAVRKKIRTSTYTLLYK